MSEQEHDQKMTVFCRILHSFETIKPSLIKAGIHENRFPRKEALLKDFEETNINKYRACEAWLKGFIRLRIDPWLKIRKENSEEVWEYYKKVGYGKEFNEVKIMNQCAHAIREYWFDNQNIFKNPKKVQKEKSK